MPPTPRAVTRGDDEYLESHPRRAPAHYYESIDYECPRNMAHARRREFSNRRRLASSSTAYVPSATSAKYALTLLVGLVVGVVAWAIEGATGRVVAAQAALVSRYYADAPTTTAALFACTSSVLVLVAGWVVTYRAPLASGGGVTAVMATLNGNDVPGLLSGRTTAAKIVGVCGGVGSALAVGPEGPMVQIGAGIASVCALWWPRRAMGEEGGGA